jgi:hypothetical protein
MQKRLRLYAGAQAEQDPFATSRCARRYHGCEIEGEAGVADEVLERRTEAGRVGKQNYLVGKKFDDDPVLV